MLRNIYYLLTVSSVLQSAVVIVLS